MKLQNLAESGLSRIHSKLSQFASGFITANRGEYTNAQNQQRNRSLLAKLQNSGLSVTGINGTYIENYGTDDAKDVNERSFFVANRTEGDDGGKLEAFLVSLGEEFDQDSILSKPFDSEMFLVGTTDREGVEPAKGERIPIGSFKGGKVAQFMSKVGSRGFIFEDYEQPQTNNGKFGNSLVAKKHWTEL